MKITSLYFVLLVFMMLGVTKAYAQPQYFEEPVTIVATGNTGGGSSSVWISLGPVLQYDPLYGELMEILSQVVARQGIMGQAAQLLIQTQICVLIISNLFLLAIIHKQRKFLT